MREFLITILIGLAGWFGYSPDLGTAPRVLTVQQGGTGVATLDSGECLVGAGTGAITTQACGAGGSNPFNQWLDTTTTPTFVGVNATTTNVGALTVYTSISLPASSIQWADIGDVPTSTTDQLPEGITNLYFTSARHNFDTLTNKPATSTILTLLDSDKRISVLNATTTNVDTLKVYTGSTFPANDIDISTETNLTAGDALTLNDDDIDFDGGVSPAGSLGGTWASPTIDDLFLLNTGDSGIGLYTLTDLRLANGGNASSTFNFLNGLFYGSATTTHNFFSGGYASSTTGLFTSGNLRIGGTTILDGRATTTATSTVFGLRIIDNGSPQHGIEIIPGSTTTFQGF